MPEVTVIMAAIQAGIAILADLVNVLKVHPTVVAAKAASMPRPPVTDPTDDPSDGANVQS